MERRYNIRGLENFVLDKITAEEFVSVLTPEEFDVLWDYTDPEVERTKILERNGLSPSQFHTVNYHLTRKALANLR